MKRMILSGAVMLLLAGGLSAQTTGSNSSRSTSQSSSTEGTTTQKSKKGKKAKTTTVDLNDRKMYKGKDGQRATPTGHEAAGTNSESFQSLKKDSTKQSAKKEEE